MVKRLAINGYGRIGRAVLRALYERDLQDQIQIVAINDLGIAESLVYETQYDSVHGVFPLPVQATSAGMSISHTPAAQPDTINIYRQNIVEQLPWQDLGIDLVMECSGKLTSCGLSASHLHAGAKKVLIGAPAGEDVDLTVVYGINHQQITADMQIISNASCTTNCMAPLLAPLQAQLGIEDGLMTTIHAYTNGQVLTDTVLDKMDLRRGRSATQSMIPTTTHSTQALGWVLPAVAGKITGYSMRVPTINVSVVDLVLRPSRTTCVDEVNNIMQQAYANDTYGVLGYNQAPLVSIDFNHNAYSTIFDSTQTMQMGELIKVLAWYDNEWGYANRMLDVALTLLDA